MLRGHKGEGLYGNQIKKSRSKQRNGEGGRKGSREGWMECGCLLVSLMMRKMEGHVGAMAGWREGGGVEWEVKTI